MLTQQPNRPLCSKCQSSLAKPNGMSKHGFQKWHKYCIDCAKAMYSQKFGYLLNKKNNCEQCGFIPKDKCQLDIIYKDGNRNNKDKANMLTLCANCSRLHQKIQKQKKKSVLNITADSDFTL